MKDRRCRHYRLTAERQLYMHVDIHARSKLQPRIREHEANRYSSRGHIDLRQNVIDATGKYFPWIGINRDLGRVAWLDLAGIILKYLSQYPDLRKIRDYVQPGVGLCIHV